MSLKFIESSFLEIQQLTLNTAQRNFERIIAIVIFEILSDRGIRNPTEEQVEEIWQDLDCVALFWEDWTFRLNFDTRSQIELHQKKCRFPTYLKTYPVFL